MKIILELSPDQINNLNLENLDFNLKNTINNSNADQQIIIGYLQDKLSIWRSNQPKTTVCVDFNHGKIAHKLKFSINKKHPLAKAAGIEKLLKPIKLLDATAGLGKDAAILARLGFKVVMVERSEILHALLSDAIKRASVYPDTIKIIENMKLLAATNSIEYMSNISQKPDVVYLDPMFPEKEKTALVQKEMQLLQFLHGPTEDTTQLFNAAIAIAKYRVVVKRPAKAAFITNKTPSYQLTGKTCRYDVYIKNR